MGIAASARAGLAFLGRHSLGTLLSVLVLGAGIWSFAELADEVRDNEAISIDESLVLAMRTPGDPDDPIGPAWFERTVRDITALGGSSVTWPLVIAIAGFLVLRRATGLALAVITAIAGANLLSWGLKGVFGRPRPELVPHAMEAGSPAFPSGHALAATAVYLTLAALLSAIQTRAIIKAYLLAWGVLIALVVGVSRVYLGVHWPTDVAAGWAIGAAWACLWWLVVRVLLDREVIRFPDQ